MAANAYKNIASKRDLRWYWKRLSVMSPAETAFRVKTLAGQALMKFKASKSKGRLWVINRSHTEFSFCVGAPNSFSSFLHAVPLALDENDLLDGKANALGFEWQWKKSGKCWHEAPDTGKQWPEKFYGDISHGPGNPYGDVRVVWEPSRLQHLLALALLYEKYKARDEVLALRAARLAVDQMLSWWKQNPPLMGVHYKSVMECALRILSLCHTMDLLRDSPSVDERAWDVFLQIIYSHSKIISSRLSLYSSLGNHTIAECTGLLYTSLLFPEFGESNGWKNRALEILEAEANHQILPDGGGAEQAFWYLRFIVDLYGCAINLLRVKGLSVPETMENRWRRGIDFLSHVTGFEGTLPDTGDRDDGWALIPYAGRISLFEEGKPAQIGARCFKEAGYTVYDSPRIKLLLDHGPLGMAPSYGHGHSDCLSIQLFYKKEPVFIDPGTYCYNCHAEWRAYFRSTKAHNTVSVDGLDQAEQRTPFMWAKPFSAEVSFFSYKDNELVTVARHNGYHRLSQPITHTRSLAVLDENTVIVLDLLDGKGDHALVLNWHVDDSWQVLHGEEGLLLKKEGAAVSMVVQGGDVAIARGREGEMIGWASEIYGRKKPITTITVTHNGTVPWEFVTVITLNGETIGQKQLASYLSYLREKACEA